MAFKEIVWSELAKMELANILEFYLLRNGNATYSFNILNEVEEIMQTLSQNEMIGRLTSNKFTRTIPMKYYAIFYEINGHIIEIVSFWDNRQDPDNSKVR
jgi:plasmid stabilization system protein ParE